MSAGRDSKSGGLPAGEPVILGDLLSYQDGAVVSRTLVKQKGGSITLFAFDKDQSLSEHTVAFDALVQILDGEAELVVGGKSVLAAAGQTVLMPANTPHAVNAPDRFKMLLVMVRGVAV